MIEIIFDDYETVVRMPYSFPVWDSKLDAQTNIYFIQQQLYAQMLQWDEEVCNVPLLRLPKTKTKKRIL